MAYEYAMWTRVFRVSWDDGTVRSHAQELQRSADAWFPELTKALSEAGGGGWEIVSHDVLRVEDGALMTIVARRWLD